MTFIVVSTDTITEEKEEEIKDFAKFLRLLYRNVMVKTVVQKISIPRIKSLGEDGNKVFVVTDKNQPKTREEFALSIDLSEDKDKMVDEIVEFVGNSPSDMIIKFAKESL